MIEGLFIVLEGVDGAGTTTQTKQLIDGHRRRGLPVHATREPSDGPIGNMLRQILGGRVVVPGLRGPRPPSWSTMALLFAADRLDHVEAEILPNLQDGVTVVSDRYVHSSVAYQSVTGDDADAVAWVKELNRHARRPDLTIVLDVPPAVASQRRIERGHGREIYDDDGLQAQLAAFYLDIEAHFPGERIVHVDGCRTVDEIAADIAREVWALRGEAV